MPRRRHGRRGPRRAAVFALACAFALSAATSAAETHYDGSVIRVIDGDTLEILVDGTPKETLRIRLAGIDAPERGQPWGRRAEEALSSRVALARVRINAVATDRYGRIVGEVYAGDVCVNCELVREGHAWVYRRYTEDAVLINLEEEARRNGRGLWGLPEGERIPPWDWRRGARAPHGASLETPAASANERPSEVAGFACAGKRRCAEMRSCEEALFQLEKCGVRALDRDGDGTPCEKLCRRR